MGVDKRLDWLISAQSSGRAVRYEPNEPTPKGTVLYEEFGVSPAAFAACASEVVEEVGDVDPVRGVVGRTIE